MLICFIACSGYMSPEYAMDGIFSTKSDVFSFGVLVLEIISGKKNKGIHLSDQRINLLAHVSANVMQISMLSINNVLMFYEIVVWTC